MENEGRDIHDWRAEVVASLHGNKDMENHVRTMLSLRDSPECVGPARRHGNVFPPVSRWSTDSSVSNDEACRDNRGTMHSILVAYSGGDQWGSLVNSNDKMCGAGHSLRDNLGKRFSLMPAPLRVSQIEPVKVVEVDESEEGDTQVPTAAVQDITKHASVCEDNSSDNQELPVTVPEPKTWSSYWTSTASSYSCTKIESCTAWMLSM
jgi:hypothetical protein